MSRRRARNGQAIIVRESGTCYVTVALSGAGNGTVLLSPDGTGLGAYSDKLLNLANVFQLFRFTKLRMRIPALGPNAGLNAMGMTAMVPVTAPTSTSAVMDLPWSWLLRDGTTTAAVNVPLTAMISKRELFESQPKWFRTVADASADNNLEYQGAIYLRGFNSTTGTLAVDYTVELTQFVGTGQTPLAQRHPALVADECKTENDFVMTDEDVTSLALALKKRFPTGVKTPQ